MLVACDEHFETKEVYGSYTPIGYKNSYDTIQLKPDSVYHRRIYNKNHKLVLEMDGKWVLERSHIIHFIPFYLNLDIDLVKFPKSVTDTSGGWGGSLETQSGNIQFCVGYYIDSNCYRKIQ